MVRYKVLFVMLLCGLAVGVQGLQAQDMTFGAKLGYTSSSLTEAEGFSSDGGLVLGGYLSLGLGKTFFLAAEGLYDQRKASSSNSEQNDSFEQVFLSVPLLIGARFGTGLLQPRIYGGVSVSFALDCKETTGGMTVGDPQCSELLDIRGQTWSGAIGAGLDVALLVLVVNADVRYNIGLTGISNDPALESKWNGWMFTLGAGIRLGQ